MKKLLLLLITLLLSFSLMGCNQEETTEGEPAASDTPTVETPEPAGLESVERGVVDLTTLTDGQAAYLETIGTSIDEKQVVLYYTPPDAGYSYLDLITWNETDGAVSAYTRHWFCSSEEIYNDQLSQHTAVTTDQPENYLFAVNMTDSEETADIVTMANTYNDIFTLLSMTGQLDENNGIVL